MLALALLQYTIEKNCRSRVRAADEPDEGTRSIPRGFIWNPCLVVVIRAFGCRLVYCTAEQRDI